MENKKSKRQPIEELYKEGQMLELTIEKGKENQLIAITKDGILCFFHKKESRPKVGAVCECEVSQLNKSSLVVTYKDTLVTPESNMHRKLQALKKKHAK